MAPSEQQKNAGALTEIRAVLRAQQEAWNRGDIDGFMNGYARSESTTFVSEDAVRRGWENVRERYLKKYSDRAKMGVLTFYDLEIMPLGPDSAVALGRWKLKRAQDRPRSFHVDLSQNGRRLAHRARSHLGGCGAVIR